MKQTPTDFIVFVEFVNSSIGILNVENSNITDHKEIQRFTSSDLLIINLTLIMMIIIAIYYCKNLAIRRIRY